MVDKELLSFVKEKYSQSMIDISDIIDMLISEIDSILDQNLKNSSLIGMDRNFEEAILYLKKAQDIDSVRQQLINFNNDIKENIISVVDNRIDLYQKSMDQVRSEYEEKDKADVHTDYIGSVINLKVDTLGRQPYQIQIKDRVISVNGWRDLYVKTCEYPANLDVEKFRGYIDNPGVNGKIRLYFSSEGGKNMINPRKIHSSNIVIEYVLPITGAKRLIQTMLEDFGIDLEEYKIYI